MIHIVLYHPEIPYNTGNIIRTASSLGAKIHIIKPFNFSLDEKELKRAAMDYINLCDIFQYESLDEFFKLHGDEAIYYISRYGKKAYSKVDFSDPFTDYFIMFGKESSGLPYDLLKKNFEHCLRIPMRPEARSLNLSNCVAIVAYEIASQQNFFSLASFETIKGNDFINNGD